MIRKVRRQFIVITMSMLTLVLLIPLVALNLITEAVRYNQTQELLEQIAISEVTLQEEQQQQQFQQGDPPEEKPAEKPLETAQEAIVSTTETTSTVTSETSETTKSSGVSLGETDAGAVVTTTVVTTHRTVKTTAKTTVKTTAKTTKATTKTTRTTTKSTQATTKATRATTKQTVAQTQTQPVQTKPVQTQPMESDQPEYGPYPEVPWYGYEDEPYYYEAAPTLSMTVSGSLSRGIVSRVSGLSDSRERKDAQPFRKSETSATIDHFLCFADDAGTLVRIEGAEDYDYTEEEGQALLTAVLNTGKTDGRYQNLQFFRKDYSSGTLVVFSDRTAERQLLRQILWVSILVFLLMEGVVLVLTLFLTKRAIKPMQDTFERQREFISDAGHELKTPLTIISANADILQDEIGENKWLSYIQSQTERMRILVTDMMDLTKLEMNDPKKNFVNFSLSAAVSSAALPFESQAFEQHKTLLLEIQDNLQYNGNPDQIKQLVGIFIDNAMKYSDPEGEIRVTLQQNREKKTLKIYNTGKGVPEEEKEKIFQRFYRSDASRARATGGYGLGLSIAQRIAETHKIKIQVESEYEHWICFTLTL